MRLSKLPPLLFLAGLSVVSGACGAASDDDGEESEAAIESGRERRAVGKAQPYPADVLTDADEQKLRTSKKARRDLGWKVLAKALEPTKIAQQDIVGLPAGEKTLPLFRTWLGPNEIDLMFAKMYTDLGKERRMKREAPTDKEWSDLLEDNAKNIYPFSEKEFFDRLGQIGSKEDLDGLGGNQRTAYSPAYAKHVLQNYAPLYGCKDKVDSFSIDAPPTSVKNFTNCFSSEMPRDAAVVKMSWKRNDGTGDNIGIAAADTSPATMAKRMSGELADGDWKIATVAKKPAPPNKIYTVRMVDINGNPSMHSLAALHVMTKELRHWVWVTVWWSDTPNEDFGADRPAMMDTFGPAWSNYKMCVVADFDEGDPDPRGGYEGSLGDALAAVHGKATWCSNPFIEKEAHNAQTNCIGCHQHSGQNNIPAMILKDETKFPLQGRTKLRTGHPMDYSWAMSAPSPKEGFLQLMLGRMQYLDDEDRRGQ